jgi:hypothetical protein
MTITKTSIYLTEKEKKLIEELRKIKYGEVVVIQVDGQPAEIDKIREKLRL